MNGYEFVGNAVRAGTDVLFGTCFAWFASQFGRPRFRGAGFVCATVLGALRAVLSLLWQGDGSSAPTALRALVLPALCYAAVAAFFKTVPRARLYVAVSFAAFFELSMFIAYSTVLAADPLYPALTNYMLRSGATDPQAVGNSAQILAAAIQILTLILLGVLCCMCCRLAARDLRREAQALDVAKLRMLLLPAATGLLMAVLLRILLVTVTDGVPSLLFDAHPTLRVVVPVLAAVALSAAVYAARTSRDIAKLEEDRRTGIAAQERVRALRAQVAAEQQVQTKTRKIRHDLRNTLTVIHALSAELPEGSALASYISDLAEDAKSLERPVVTGDAVVDVLLEAKRCELLEAVPDASFDDAGLFLPAEGVPSYDLGIIFGNALDNAIEAVKAQQGGAHFVRVSSFVRGGLLAIRFENTCRETPLVDEDGLPTSTGAPERGTGMRSIWDIALCHGGVMDWKWENGKFTLLVMLKVRAADQPAAPTPAPDRPGAAWADGA